MVSQENPLQAEERSLKSQLTLARRAWAQANRLFKSRKTKQYESIRAEYTAALKAYSEFLFKNRSAAAAQRLRDWEGTKIQWEGNRLAVGVLGAGALVATGVGVVGAGVAGVTQFVSTAAVGASEFVIANGVNMGWGALAAAGVKTGFWAMHMAGRHVLNGKATQEAAQNEQTARAQGMSFEEFRGTKSGKFVARSVRNDRWRKGLGTLTAIGVGIYTFATLRHSVGAEIAQRTGTGDFLARVFGVDPVAVKASLSQKYTEFSQMMYSVINGKYGLVTGFGLVTEAAAAPTDGPELRRINLGTDPFAQSPEEAFGEVKGLNDKTAVERAADLLAKREGWSQAKKDAFIKWCVEHRAELIAQAKAGQGPLVDVLQGRETEVSSMVEGPKNGGENVVGAGRVADGTKAIVIVFPYVENGVAKLGKVIVPIEYEVNGQKKSGCFNFADAMEADKVEPKVADVVPPVEPPSTCERADWFVQKGTLIAEGGKTKIANLLLILKYTGSDIGDVEEYLRKVSTSGFIPENYQGPDAAIPKNLTPDCRVIWVAFTDCDTGKTVYRCWDIDKGGWADRPLAVVEADGDRNVVDTMKEFDDATEGTGEKGNTNVHPKKPIPINAVDKTGDGIPDVPEIARMQKGQIVSRQLGMILEDVFGENVPPNVSTLLNAPIPEDFVRAVEAGKHHQALEALKRAFGLTDEQARILRNWLMLYSGNTKSFNAVVAAEAFRNPDGSMKTLGQFMRDAIGRNVDAGVFNPNETIMPTVNEALKKQQTPQ